MTLDEIQFALSNAMQTGRLGTPVAARVQVMRPSDGEEPDALLARIVETLSPCFDEPPATLRARRHENGRLTSVLLQTESGRTIFITCGFANRPAFHLLVVGNHGIVRLEGAEEFALDDLHREANDTWATAINESCASGEMRRL